MRLPDLVEFIIICQTSCQIHSMIIPKKRMLYSSVFLFPKKTHHHRIGMTFIPVRIYHCHQRSNDSLFITLLTLTRIVGSVLFAKFHVNRTERKRGDSKNRDELAKIWCLCHIVDDLWGTLTKMTSGQHVTSLLSTQITSCYSNRKFRPVDANKRYVLWDSTVT